MPESHKQQSKGGESSTENEDLTGDKVEQAAERLARILVMEVEEEIKDEN